MEDSRIVELYWQKNADAIKETDSKYGAYCFAIADNILHNKEDSEECVNDTWLNAWNAMPPQKPTKLQMFLAKITRNLSFNRFQALSAKKRGLTKKHFLATEASSGVKTAGKLSFPFFMIGTMLLRGYDADITMGCSIESSKDEENHFTLLWEK